MIKVCGSTNGLSIPYEPGNNTMKWWSVSFDVATKYNVYNKRSIIDKLEVAERGPKSNVDILERFRLKLRGVERPSEG